MQAAVESGNDIRPMIEKYLENLLVDRDKFIRAYKQLESVNKDEVSRQIGFERSHTTFLHKLNKI